MNKKIGLNGTNWTVYEDENVFITPDISPVLKGHFLIVSKEHINFSRKSLLPGAGFVF